MVFILWLILFQFQLLDSEKIEKDASGKCLTKYISPDPHTIIKLKIMCALGKKIPYQVHPEKVKIQFYT